MTMTTTEVQDMLDGMDGNGLNVFQYRKQFTTRNKSGTITVEWWNVGREDAIDRLLNGEPQRFVFGCPEMLLELEIMILPLDEEYSSTRMKGADSQYCMVAVPGFGAYAFRLFQKHDLVAPYIADKLRLPADMGIAMEYFLADIMEGLNERSKG